MPGRASGIKLVGMAEVGAPISQDGTAVHPDYGASACVIFILLQKIQKMANKDTIFGCPHMPTQTGSEETQLERSTTLC